MKNKILHATEVQLCIAREKTTGNVETIRTTATEREWLGKLARNYSIKKSEVWRRLLRQAITDYIVDGEVFALTQKD